MTNLARKLLLSAAALAFAGSASLAQDAVLINLADTHSAYDAYGRIITKVGEVADSYADVPVYILVNGDIMETGVVVGLRNEGYLDWLFLESLNEVAPVVINIGNHEFDFFDYQAFIDGAAERDLTVIGGVSDVNAGALQPTATALPVGNDTLTVVGIATDQITTYPAAIRDSLAIDAPVNQLRDFLAANPFADDLLVMSHSGVPADKQILALLDPAKTVYVVGGHDHLHFQAEINGIPYFHNGFRGELISVVELHRSADGWDVLEESVLIDESVAVNPGFAKEVAFERLEWLGSEDLAYVGTVESDMSFTEAIHWSIEVLRDATGADIAVANHTTYGSALPAGPLSRYRFDEFMRFDNDVVYVDVDGATLEAILVGSNQDAGTPVEERKGDFIYATPLPQIEPDRTYRLVTSSFVALDFNQGPLLNVEGLEFTTIDGVTTKGITRDALR